MADNYPKAYKEVIEILKYVSEDYTKKIPLEVLTVFEKEMDKEYKYKINENEKFEKQELLPETKAILESIYIRYWASPKERKKIYSIYQDAKIKLEEEKIKIYGEEINFFKKMNNKDIKEKIITKNEITYILLLLKLGNIVILEEKNANIFLLNIDKSRYANNYIILNNCVDEILNKLGDE